MEIINLAGEWSLVEDKRKIPFKLPGSTCDNKYGEKKEYFSEFNEKTTRTVLERYEYIGRLILERTIVIPKEAEGKRVRLFFERINVASELFIDGVQIGRKIVSLSTPHVYDLTDKVAIGEHTLRLVLDNSNIVKLADVSSGYSRDTMGYWNGVIGRLELQYEEKNAIEKIDVYPKEDELEVKLTLNSANTSPESLINARLNLMICGPDNNSLGQKEYDVILYSTRQHSVFSISLTELKNSLEYWDEFDPNLYKIKAQLYVENQLVSEKETYFGYRLLEVVDKKLTLNKREIALRGNVNCAQFPLTGYCPMDIDSWIKQLSIYKEYGLNHVRFHAWCPPEAAFVACDRIGLYALVEMPLWLNKDVTGSEVGDDLVHEIFLTRELRQILYNYGNHPSFCFMSNGNENMGDFALLDDLNAMGKAMDNRHLYTMTSNFDHPVTSNEDFFLAFQAKGKRIRINSLHEEVAKATNVNFQEAVDDMPVPIVSFEVGQYCVYPDIDCIDDYSGGNMLPANFEIIRQNAIKAGVYEKKEDYIKASGNLAARLYKEDIEAVLRTKGMGGYELLTIVDYTGQTTATVGIIDIFGRDKGVVDKEYWRDFCGPVVPLFISKRIFSNREKLQAKLDLYDYGKEKINNPIFDINIFNSLDENDVIYRASTSNKELEIDISNIETAKELTVEVSVENHKNSWKIYVFPEEKMKAFDLKTETIKGTRLESSYIPVFWSPIMFPQNKPCGAIINEKHPSLKAFPTGIYPDYQWKTLLNNGVAVDRDEIEGELDVIIELVPNFKCNSKGIILYVNKSEGKLYSGFDLSLDDLPTNCLKKSLIDYCIGEKLELVQLK